jgi:hypothetical protein
MSGHISALVWDMRRRAALVASAFAVVLMAATTSWPQQQDQPRLQLAPAEQAVPQATEPAPAPEPPRSNPGLVEEIGKLLKDSASGLSSTLPTPKEALDNLNAGAKGASDGLKRIAPLPSQAVVSGRALCPVAANGAPDCKAAAEQLCREKGYRDGASADIESTQKCSAKAYLSGQGACRTENFVTRAVCQ